MSSGNYQTTKTISKATDGASETETKGLALLLNAIPVQTIDNREIKLVPAYHIYPYGLVLMVLENTPHTTIREQQQTCSVQSSRHSGRTMVQDLWK